MRKKICINRFHSHQNLWCLLLIRRISASITKAVDFFSLFHPFIRYFQNESLSIENHLPFISLFCKSSQVYVFFSKDFISYGKLYEYITSVDAIWQRYIRKFSTGQIYRDVNEDSVHLTESSITKAEIGEI